MFYYPDDNDDDDDDIIFYVWQREEAVLPFWKLDPGGLYFKLIFELTVINWSLETASVLILRFLQEPRGFPFVDCQWRQTVAYGTQF